MSFPATIWVDSAGRVYGASDTDQRYTRARARTVDGRRVECAGTWYGSQMSYRPYRRAVARAAALAAQCDTATAS